MDKKMLIIAVLSAAILIFLPKPVSAWEESQPTWNSIENYYEIRTIEELQWIHNDPDNSYVIMNDIDAENTRYWDDNENEDDNSGFLPISYLRGNNHVEQGYNATIDGRMHKIKNLYIHRENEDNVGLFSDLSGTWGIVDGFVVPIYYHVENIIIENAYVVGKNNVGILCGKRFNPECGTWYDDHQNGIWNIIIRDSYVCGENNVGGVIGLENSKALGGYPNVINTTIEGENYVGGIWGNSVIYPPSGDIDEVTINGSNYVGGLGGSYGSTAPYQTISGNVKNSIINGDNYVGGFYGYAEYIYGSPIDGEIFDSSIENTSINGGRYVGGIAGTFRSVGCQMANFVIGEENLKVLGNTFSGILFGYIENLSETIITEYKPRIENFIIKASLENGRYNAGGIAGYAKNLVIRKGEIDIVIENNMGDYNENIGGIIGCSENSIIENCTVGESSILCGRYNVGGLIGYNNSGYIENSCFIGHITSSSLRFPFREAGGLIGTNRNGTIKNSYAIDNIYGETYFGGLIGKTYYGNIEGSYFIGNLVANIGPSIVGGIVAEAQDRVIIENCSSYTPLVHAGRFGGIIGETETFDYSENFIIKNCYSEFSCYPNIDQYDSGGIVGFADNILIENCRSNGYFYAPYNSSDIGGIVGIIIRSSIIKNCYSTVSVDGGSYIGGIVGTFGGFPPDNDDTLLISNSYSISSLNCSDNVGGIIGRNRGYTNITTCYSAGLINGDDAGGLIGNNQNTVIVTNSFWDIETTGQTSSSGGGTGKTTEEMKDVRTYTDTSWSNGLSEPWDFAFNPYDDENNRDLWGLNPDVNDGYPFLTIFGEEPLGFASEISADEEIVTGMEITVSGSVTYADSPYFAIETAVIHDSLVGDVEATIDGNTYSATYTVRKGAGEIGYIYATGTGSSWQSNTIQYTVVPSSIIPPIIPEEEEEEQPPEEEEQPPPIEEQPPGVPVEPWYRQRDINLIPTFPPPVTPTETKTPIYYWIGALFPLLLLCALTFPKEEWENTYGNNTGGSPPGSWTFISGESVPLFMVAVLGMGFVGLVFGVGFFFMVYGAFLLISLLIYMSEVRSSHAPLAFIGIRGTLKMALFGIFFGLLWFVASGIGADIFALDISAQNVVPFSLSSIGLSVFTIGILVPTIETFFFFSVLGSTLAERTGIAPSIFLAGMVFGLAHMLFGAGSGLVMSAVIFGAITQFFMLRNQSIIVPLTSHMAYNTACVLIPLLFIV